MFTEMLSPTPPKLYYFQVAEVFKYLNYIQIFISIVIFLSQGGGGEPDVDCPDIHQYYGFMMVHTGILTTMYWYHSAYFDFQIPHKKKEFNDELKTEAPYHLIHLFPLFIWEPMFMETKSMSVHFKISGQCFIYVFGISF
jgi:hypothetical protein